VASLREELESETRAVIFTRLLPLIGGILAAVLLLGLILSRRLVDPLQELIAAARAISERQWDTPLPVTRNDEIGLLSRTLQRMTQQLRDTIVGLEDRVLERTRQLETTLEISQKFVTILDLSDLLRQVVTLTKETFDYYHVHIYILDNLGENPIIAEGYGEAGLELKRQRHSISVTTPQSLVARAAREGEVVLVENVRENPNWLPNPLLPETHSEMAVPIKAETKVVGVLDVQSERVGGLTIEDKATLQVLANQIAVAVRNANLFTETQEKLYEAQRLQRLYTGQAWEKLGALRQTTNYEVRQAALPPIEEISTPEFEAVLHQKQTVDIKWQPMEHEANDQQQGQSPQMVTALATPLKLRDQIIGALGVHDVNPDRRWTQDEIALIEAVSEQMSLAIENARLFEETGRRANREKVIADMTQQVWASGELEQVLKTAVEQLGSQLGASEVIIRLGSERDLVAATSEEVV
jgi:GAF domain-containing protein/HAMP domain-containing protein